MFDRTKWIAFLERYELRGANGKGGCSEVTDGFIVHAAVFGDNQCDPGTYKATKMALLRVGKVRHMQQLKEQWGGGLIIQQQTKSLR
jgi:hypothetical protein